MKKGTCHAELSEASAVSSWKQIKADLPLRSG